MDALSQTTLILLSGFLGSGKTTLMLAAADRLRSAGRKVACITNDQGSQLVDSKMVGKKELPLAQIEGGCFCCRFEELDAAIIRIIDDNSADVIIAEAVGSCTDLIATVVKPLLRFHGDRLDIRPLTVVVDPLRFAESRSDVRTLTPEITYLFNKQLEEAQCLLLNKSDLLEAEAFAGLARELSQNFAAEIMTASTVYGIGVDEWLDRILQGELSPLPRMEIDYDLYAEGEAQLGWYNGSFAVRGSNLDGAELCRTLFSRLTGRIQEAKAEIAHLKLWAEAEGHVLKMSSVGSGYAFRVDTAPDTVWTTGCLSIWLNARVRISYGILQTLFEDILDGLANEYHIEIESERVDCFAPGRPQPTYRLA